MTNAARTPAIPRHPALAGCGAPEPRTIRLRGSKTPRPAVSLGREDDSVIGVPIALSDGTWLVPSKLAGATVRAAGIRHTTWFAVGRIVRTARAAEAAARKSAWVRSARANAAIHAAVVPAIIEATPAARLGTVTTGRTEYWRGDVRRYYAAADGTSLYSDRDGFRRIEMAPADLSALLADVTGFEAPAPEPTPEPAPAPAAEPTPEPTGPTCCVCGDPATQDVDGHSYCADCADLCGW